MSKCFFCQKDLEFKTQPGRTEECPYCFRDLHCCLQCAFYDEAYNNQCREPQSSRETIKDRCNFCDWFQFGREDAARQMEKESIKGKLDSLFKKNA